MVYKYSLLSLLNHIDNASGIEGGVRLYHTRARIDGRIQALLTIGDETWRATLTLDHLAMPRSNRLLAALIAAPIAALSAAALAAPGALVLQLKQSERVMLPGQVANVVIDDPNIADVAMVDGHSVIVIGKGYGSTGILVLDKGGRTLMRSQIAVIAPEVGPVTVYNGATPSEFSCLRRCQPLAAPVPNANGDGGAESDDSGPAKAVVQP